MSLSLSGVDIDAFVLAGGRSSRMGQDKALTHLQGVRLVEHALGILRRMGLDPRIAGGSSELSAFAQVIPDEHEWAGLGPLAGLCSALAATTARYSVFLPIDLPLIPPGLISCMVHHAIISESAVTAASVAGFVQTFPSVIDRAVLSGLEASLESTDRMCIRAFKVAAKAVFGGFAVLPVEVLIQAGQVRAGDGLPAPHWFLNVNTPDDLALAVGLLSGRERGGKSLG